MTRVTQRLGAVTVFALMFAGTASAQQRQFIGARNVGMGNVGVANTTNALSVYFNPAGMAFARGWDVQLPLVTVDAEVGGDIFRDVDEIVRNFDGTSLTEVQQRFNDGTATRDDLAAVLGAFLYDVPDLVSRTSGGNLRGSTGLAFRYKNWGVSTAVIGVGGADTRLDLSTGLSLSPDLNYGAVPADGSCGGDSNCLTLAADLLTLSGGGLSQAQAETLVDAAGSQLYDNPFAQTLLGDIVTATGSAGSGLEDNPSGLDTTTLALSQIAGTYSRRIWKDKLAVGVNLKVMRGEAARAGVTVAGLERGEDTFEGLIDDQSSGKTSTELGLDVGLMYRPDGRWSIGIVANNVNAPSFEFNSGGSFKLKSRWTAGGSYTPVKWFNVAVDVDLNEVDSQVSRSYAYQYWNVGAEFLVGRVVSIWAGGYENFAARFADPVLTGGLGLRFGRFEIGLSAAVSTRSIDLDDDNSLPSGGAFALSLAWLPKRS